MLYFFLIILAGTCVVLTVFLRRANAKIGHIADLENFWYQKWMSEIEDHIRTDDELRLKTRQLTASMQNYDALEQGRDEESEAYEMQFLSFSELLEKQTEVLEDTGLKLALHYDWCLPDVDDIQTFTGYMANPGEYSPIYDALVLEMAG